MTTKGASDAIAKRGPARVEPRGAEPAVLLVDAQLRVRLRNGAADTLVSDGVIALDADSRIAGAFASRLSRSLGQLRDPAPLLLQTPDQKDCYLGVCVTPLRAAEAGGEPLFVLILRDAGAELHARARAVARRNGLTECEERLLLLIVDGLDPRSAAQRLGVARSTARTHLQRVFEKVGVGRQSELVAFIARLSSAAVATSV